MDIPKGFTEVSDIPSGFSEVKDIPSGFSEVSKKEDSSILDSFASLGKSALGTAEAGVNLATFMPRAFGSTVGALAGKAAGEGDYSELFNKNMERFAVPENEYGKTVSGVLALPGELAHKAGEYTFDKSGSPILATGVETGLNAAMFAAPLIGGKKALETTPRVEPTFEGKVISPEPTVPTEARPSGMDYNSIVQKKVDIAESQKQYSEKKIEQLQKRIDSTDISFDSPEKAQQFATALKEEIVQHKSKIEQLDKTIENGNKILGKTREESVVPPEETPTPSKGTTFAEARAWRESPEGIAYYKNLEENASRIEQENKLNSSEQLQFDFIKNNPASLKDYLNDPSAEIGSLAEKVKEDLDSVSSYKETHPEDTLGNKRFETQLNDHLEELIRKTNRPEKPLSSGMDEIRLLSDEELDQRIASTNLGTKEGRIENDLISQRLKEEIPVEEPTRTAEVYRGSPEVRALVNEWIDKLGLSKEDLAVFLESDKLAKDSWVGDFTVKTHPHTGVQAGVVRVRGAKALEEALDRNPNLRKWFSNLSNEQNAKFKEAFAVAHELGHMLLTKLVQNHLWTDSLGVSALIRDYNFYLRREGKDKVRTEGDLLGKPSEKDYFLDFPEYFSQRVAKILTLGEEAPKGAIKGYIDRIRDIWQQIRKTLNLPAFSKNFVDEFIMDTIAKNKDTLEQTGKTLFELDSTKVSLQEAWKYQIDNLFPNVPKKSSIVESGMADTNNSRQNANIEIEDIQKVIAKQLDIPDIRPFGSGKIMSEMGSLVMKGTSHMFGFLTKGEIFRDSPVISHASSVIQSAITTQIKRSSELLSGTPLYSAWDKTNRRFWTNLQRVKSEKAFSVVADKSSNEDFWTIHQILQAEDGKLTAQESYDKHSLSLTPQQRDLFQSMISLYDATHKMVEEAETTLGKKNIISKRKGWYPIGRQGNFVINFYHKGLHTLNSVDPAGGYTMTDLAYSHPFRTEYEAQVWLDKYNASPEAQMGDLIHYGVQEVKPKTQTQQDYNKIVQEQTAKLKEQLRTPEHQRPKWLNDEFNSYSNGGGLLPKDIPDIIADRMQRLNDSFEVRGGVLGGHHKLRAGIPGYEGAQMFKTIGEAGKDFRDAHFNMVNEYTNMLKKMEIKQRLESITEHPELSKSHPNITDMVDLMKKYALNETDNILEFKKTKDWIDRVWAKTFNINPLKPLGAEQFPKAPIADIIAGKGTNYFYISSLISRPLFIAQQSIQGILSTRTLVRDNQGPISAIMATTKGIGQLINPDKDFMQALFHSSQNSHVFDPQFIHALNVHGIAEFMKEGGKGKQVFDLLTLEKPATMADTFSRLHTYAMMYEHHKALGLSGEDLYRAAAKDTDVNMVQYGRQYVAPVFQELGVVGALTKPLLTFPTSALGNIIADLRLLTLAKGGRVKLQASLPFLATFFLTGVITGVLGLPFSNEVDQLQKMGKSIQAGIEEYTWGSRLVNYLSNELGVPMHMPTFIDLALEGENNFLNRAVSHGLPSAATLGVSDSGFDVASSLRFNAIFNGVLEGEKSFAQSLTVLDFYMKKPGDVYDILRPGSTEAERRSATMDIAPGYTKGIVDLAWQEKTPGGRKAVPNIKGEAFVKQTPSETVAKFLGTSTLTSSTERLRNRRMDVREREDAQRVDSLVKRIADAVQNKNNQEVVRLARITSTKYLIDPKQIETRVMGTIFRRTLPEEQRRFVDMNGNVSDAGKVKFIHWMETYKDNPFKEGE